MSTAGKKQPQKLAASAQLVPVQAVVPERYEGEGAIVILRDGSFRMILSVGTINFEMKSAPEREGLTHAFGDMLDSLSPETPIQIISRSKALDTGAYVRQFDAVLKNDRTPPTVRALIKAHIEHYETTVKTQNLLQRDLYLTVPWKKVGGPVTESLTDNFPFADLWREVSKWAERKAVKQRTPTETDIVQARQRLNLRVEDIEARLQQMGLWSRRLDERGIRRLLYECYHPSLSQRQQHVDFDVEDRLIPGFSSQGRSRAADSGWDDDGEMPRRPSLGR
jgi:hypothetical protein